MNIDKGDTVVCINVVPNETIGRAIKLTLGREYEVIDIEDSNMSNMYMITVRNDNDEQFGYYDYRFSNLRKDRKMKLERLNKNSKS